MAVNGERFKVGDRVAPIGNSWKQGWVAYRFEGRVRVVYGVRWASGAYDLIDATGQVFTSPELYEVERLTAEGWPEIERPNNSGAEL